jgi:hypothetical protein
MLTTFGVGMCALMAGGWSAAALALCLYPEGARPAGMLASLVGATLALAGVRNAYVVAGAIAAPSLVVYAYLRRLPPDWGLEDYGADSRGRSRSEGLDNG